MANKMTQQQIRDSLGVRVQVGDIVTIQGAQLLWPHFSGVKDEYNSEGDRNFNIRLTDKEADDLGADGWNVKCQLPREEDIEKGDTEKRCTLKLNANYGGTRPPRIITIGDKSRNRTELTTENVAILDSADIKECDLTFVPYFWAFNGNSGMSAYLRTAYITLIEDELDMKYAEDNEA